MLLRVLIVGITVLFYTDNICFAQCVSPSPSPSPIPNPVIETPVPCDTTINKNVSDKDLDGLIAKTIDTNKDRVITICLGPSIVITGDSVTISRDGVEISGISEKAKPKLILNNLSINGAKRVRLKNFIFQNSGRGAGISLYRNASLEEISKIDFQKATDARSSPSSDLSLSNSKIEKLLDSNLIGGINLNNSNLECAKGITLKTENSLGIYVDPNSELGELSNSYVEGTSKWPGSDAKVLVIGTFYISDKLGLKKSALTIQSGRVYSLNNLSLDNSALELNNGHVGLMNGVWASGLEDTDQNTVTLSNKSNINSIQALRLENGSVYVKDSSINRIDNLWISSPSQTLSSPLAISSKSKIGLLTNFTIRSNYAPHLEGYGTATIVRNPSAAPEVLTHALSLNLSDGIDVLQNGEIQAQSIKVYTCPTEKSCSSVFGPIKYVGTFTPWLKDTAGKSLGNPSEYTYGKIINVRFK